jgi:uncharacterized protein YchJ
MWHEHDHEHTHHEGEESCNDPTHHHHPRFHHEHEESCHNPNHIHHHQSAPHQRVTPKTGRNDLCYCGSGQKFKRCHGV